MTRLNLLRIALAIAEIAVTASIFAEGVELRDLDIAGWDCLNRPEGSAKSSDGAERNRGKNRLPVSLADKRIETLDTAGFLKKVAQYDLQFKANRRSQIAGSQKQQLESFENQIVSLTGYLVLSYPGPPESCNCGNAVFHDFHLEVFENSSDHAPRVGDPTPIICEITPRTERAIYRDSVRLQSLTEFFRLPDKSYKPTGHKASLIRVTGFLLFDDDHNGSADVGKTIQNIGSNKFHHPWRSTAWEIHPVIKVEVVQGSTSTGSPTNPPLASPQPANSESTAAPAPSVESTVVQPQATATLSVPVTLHTSAGFVTLPAGTRLPVVSGTASTIRIQYMSQQFDVPVSATGASH